MARNVLWPVGLAVGVGMIQYAPAAFSTAATGNSTSWELSVDAQSSVGGLVYIKDMFLLLFSIYWPVMAVKMADVRLLPKLRLYFVWIMLLVGLGLFPFVLDFSPPLFIMPGLRWLMLLHASVGLAVLLASSPLTPTMRKTFSIVVLVMVLINLQLVLRQFGSVSVGLNARFGSLRLTGIFGHTGTVAAFSLGIALIAVFMNGINAWLKSAIMLAAMICAMGAGSRYGMISIAALTIALVLDGSDNRRLGALRTTIRMLIVPAALILIPIAYSAMITAVDRGNLIEQQLEQGGRVSNLAGSLAVISDSGMVEFLFGRGVGIGTNTGVGTLLRQGIDPGIYRFNLLVDNSFLTAFFQFGLIGSFVFWVGLYSLLTGAKPARKSPYVRRYWVLCGIVLLICMAGNLFEQYYLMVGIAVGIGLLYRDKLAATPVIDRPRYRPVTAARRLPA